MIVNVETHDAGQTWEVEEAWIGYKTEKRIKGQTQAPRNRPGVHHEPGYLFGFSKVKPLASVRFMFQV